MCPRRECTKEASQEYQQVDVSCDRVANKTRALRNRSIRFEQEQQAFTSQRTWKQYTGSIHVNSMVPVARLQHVVLPCDMVTGCTPALCLARLRQSEWISRRRSQAWPWTLARPPPLTRTPSTLPSKAQQQTPPTGAYSLTAQRPKPIFLQPP